jgi:hypothetical protein
MAATASTTPGFIAGLRRAGAEDASLGMGTFSHTTA